MRLTDKDLTEMISTADRLMVGEYSVEGSIALTNLAIFEMLQRTPDELKKGNCNE
jgi:hypothetical protein